MSGEAEAIGRLGTVDSASFLIEELFRRPTRAELLTGFVGLTIAGGILYVTTRKLWRYLLEKEPSVESSTKCGSWAGIMPAITVNVNFNLENFGVYKLPMIFALFSNNWDSACPFGRICIPARRKGFEHFVNWDR